MHHINADVNRSLISAFDEACQWERNTGRENLILFLPYRTDEKVVLAINGKPTTLDEPHLVLAEIASAYGARGKIELAKALHELAASHSIRHR